MSKISNPQVEVPKTTEMNDRDYLNTLLELEKNMSNNLSIALNEASCDKLFNFEFLLFTETKGMARDLYDMMFESGWYSLEKADKNKINEVLGEMETNLNQLIISRIKISKSHGMKIQNITEHF